ncbi:hypothetical protein [Kitasatospora sp. NPDC002040]|uniref:hypothetical protein n=1 Tax=Kitasatospora sp. NPDC002040 TaxID=3154661 RepID=UPI003318B896
MLIFAQGGGDPGERRQAAVEAFNGFSNLVHFGRIGTVAAKAPDAYDACPDVDFSVLGDDDKAAAA